jgi:broad specificity phosphatase PhoE
VIYLCRHGETDFNLIGRRQGQADSALTPLGQAQARAMGQRLAGLVGQDFRIFASPLGRAQQSARLIAAALGDAPITLDPRLMEIGMGSWDGKTDAEIAQSHPQLSARFGAEELWFHSPDGEGYDDFAARLDAAMEALHADEAAVKVVVAHGVVSRVIRARHQGLSRAEGLRLPVPQHGFFALGPRGSAEFIAAT